MVGWLKFNIIEKIPFMVHLEIQCITFKTETSFIAHPWIKLSVVGLEVYSAHDWRAATSVQRAPVTWREWGLWMKRRTIQLSCIIVWHVRQYAVRIIVYPTWHTYATILSIIYKFYMSVHQWCSRYEYNMTISSHCGKERNNDVLFITILNCTSNDNDELIFPRRGDVTVISNVCIL